MKSQILDDTYDGKEDKQTEKMLDCLLTFIDDAKIIGVMNYIENKLSKEKRKQDKIKEEYKNIIL